MAKICPKCGYERKNNDDLHVPVYECPKCGIVYEKYIKRHELHENRSNERADDKVGNEANRELNFNGKKTDGKEGAFTNESKPKSKQSKSNKKLVPCGECGHLISKKAKKCPSCGAVKNNGFGCFGIAVLFSAVIVLISMCSESNNPARYANKATKPLTRSEQVRKCFSGFDGSHYRFVRAVKERLNDPSSFEHVSTKFVDNGSNKIGLYMKFRAKNAFGALIVDDVFGKADLETCDVLTVEF